MGGLRSGIKRVEAAGRIGRGVKGKPPAKLAEAALAVIRAGGTIKQASAAIGMQRSSLRKWCAKDAEFRAAYEAAIEEGVEVLEAEAFRRAVEGTLKPAFYQGKVVKDESGALQGVREYSDQLLMFLLRAKAPEKYRERYEMSGRGSIGGPTTVEMTAEDANRKITVTLTNVGVPMEKILPLLARRLPGEDAAKGVIEAAVEEAGEPGPGEREEEEGDGQGG